MKQNCDFEALQDHRGINQQIQERKKIQCFKITFLNLFSHMKNREWTLTYGTCAEVEVDNVILNV